MDLDQKKLRECFPGIVNDGTEENTKPICSQDDSKEKLYTIVDVLCRHST